MSDYVILLHGLGKTSAIMKRMEHAFQDAGYQVLNIDYPSRKKTIADLAGLVHVTIGSFAKDKSKKIHFIGHSMGGLLIRCYLAKYRPENLGRVVMLGTPNHGSEVADWLKNNPLYKWYYGPAGQELTTDHDFDAIFGHPDFETGIIAGNRTLDAICYFILPRPNDGKVSVESTKLQGMKGHIVLPVSHTLMPLHKNVIEEAKAYIQNGCFNA